MNELSFDLQAEMTELAAIEAESIGWLPRGGRGIFACGQAGGGAGDHRGGRAGGGEWRV